MKESSFDLMAYALIIVMFFLTAFLLTFIAASFEAGAYERVTGKSVSAWDAIFLELRVEGCAG